MCRTKSMKRQHLQHPATNRKKEKNKTVQLDLKYFRKTYEFVPQWCMLCKHMLKISFDG